MNGDEDSCGVVDEEWDRSGDSVHTALPRRAVLATGVMAAGVMGTSTFLAGCVDGVGSPVEGASEPTSDETSSVYDRALETGLAARRSVVKVDRGTGWVIDDGLVLTCSHVARDETATIETFDGHTVDGVVIGRHERTDLALLEYDGATGEPLELGTTENLDTKSARSLLQIGHPNGVGSWIVSLGTFVRTVDSTILADVPCGPGSSGSPVLTLSGSVIGTATGTTVSIEGPRTWDRPETVFEEFRGQRLLVRAASAETILDCVEHLR